jgi:hypothetical protein
VITNALATIWTLHFWRVWLGMTQVMAWHCNKQAMYRQHAYFLKAQTTGYPDDKLYA